MDDGFHGTSGVSCGVHCRRFPYVCLYVSRYPDGSCICTMYLYGGHASLMFFRLVGFLACPTLFVNPSG